MPLLHPLGPHYASRSSTLLMRSVYLAIASAGIDFVGLQIKELLVLPQSCRTWRFVP